MNVFKEESAVKFVGIFVGEVASLSGWPAVCWSLLDNFEEIVSVVLIIRVLASPK